MAGDIQPLGYEQLNRSKSVAWFHDFLTVFGINAINGERCCSCLNFRVSNPTVTRSEGTYFLGKELGKERRWELCIELNGVVRMWQKLAPCNSRSFYVAMNLKPRGSWIKGGFVY